MNFTDWSNDANARAVYRDIENALGPTLARIMPEFNMVKLGIREPNFDRSDEVLLVVHLKPNGLRMPAERDPMAGFNWGDLETQKTINGMEVKKLK